LTSSAAAAAASASVLTPEMLSETFLAPCAASASRFPIQEPSPPSHVNKPLTAYFSPRGANMLVSVLVTFLVVILVLYLINMLPIDGRAKQICRVVVIILGVISLLKYINVV
jgi:hypothetical protein